MLIHAICFAALWTGWSWTAIGVAVALYWFRMFAITAFYHRYFSHRTFKTHRALQFAFAHMPVVNRLFHSAPLDASAWGRVILAGAGVLVVVEFEKGIRRALGKATAADSA